MIDTLQKLRIIFTGPVQIGVKQNKKGIEPLYRFYCKKHGFVTSIEHSNGLYCPQCREEFLNAVHSRYGY